LGTSPGQDVYDLRTGAKLAVRLPDQGSLIAGHWAASYKTDPSFGRTNNVDIVLTDLETGESKTVTSFGVERYYSPVFALSADWLVVLKPAKEVPTDVDSTTTLPDQHIGADLVAFHLPDLSQFDLSGVVGQGETGSVQVSGDTVLLGVAPAIEPMPHNRPDWISLRVLSLPDPSESRASRPPG
jgi:hypothetical protein